MPCRPARMHRDGPGWCTRWVLTGLTAREERGSEARRAPPEYGLFGHGPEYTVGVEEEFMLVDADTLALVPAAPSLLRETGDPDNIKAEVRQCMVEISSQPWRTTRELHHDLRALRQRVRLAASAQRCRVAGGGTHAFSPPQEQAVTDTARYHDVITESGFPGRWSLVLGTHVHVALSSADKAIGVTEALLADLPTLVALGASSPVWSGVDTGMASMRLALWASVPRSGVPPRFSSFADYVGCLDVLQRSGAVPDASHVWWDVRSQQRLGTLEVRLLDGQPGLADTVALAGLVQALVRHHGMRWDEGERVAPQRFLVAENRWQAIWKGMDARFADPDGSVITARSAVEALLDRVAQDASALEASWALGHVADLADQGGPAARVREILTRTGDPISVMREVVELTEAGGYVPGIGGLDGPGRGTTVDVTDASRAANSDTVRPHGSRLSDEV